MTAHRPVLLCFAGRPFQCASTLLLEIGARSGGNNSGVIYGDLGLLIHKGYDAFGATIGILGYEQTDDVLVVYAARYRRYLGRWGVAVDVSVGFAGGLAATEIALGWADVMAITAGSNSLELDDGRRETIFTTGFRVGSVTIGGLLYVTALAFSGAR